MLKVIELFAGTGAATEALKNLGVPHEVVAISEVDRFADTAYRALHGADANNLGDITKIEELPEADLWTYGFPCQDISVAGNGAGLDKGSGTRSGLLWEVERLLLKARDSGTLPKYLLLENVKNLIGKQHKANYDAWVAFLSGLGYTTYTKVLNAKNYGVPQNRERVFGVSVFSGVDVNFIFPPMQELTLRLKDILDDEVDAKFYLKESTIKSIMASNFVSRRKSIHKQSDICRTLAARDYKEAKAVIVAGTIDEGKWGRLTEMHQRVYDPEGISPTITSCGGGNQEKKIILDDFYPNRVRTFEAISPTLRAGREGLKVCAMRGRNPDNPSDRTTGVPLKQRLEARDDELTNTLTTCQKDNLILYNQYNDTELGDIAPTQTSSCGNVTSSAAVLQIKDCTIRKLTPTECWRLMGWSDEQIAKVAAVISHSQMYKTAGNGIVVDVLEAIFKSLFLGGGDGIQADTEPK